MLIDDALMPLFRYPDNPLSGYYLGTFVLALASVIIGEYSMAIALRLNRDMIGNDNSRMNHFHDLSVKALNAGDKAAFTACNSFANEAYGKNFFNHIALSAASLWPLLIALGWMQYRFAGIEINLPFTSEFFSLGYLSSFIMCYVFARFVTGKFKRSFFWMERS